MATADTAGGAVRDRVTGVILAGGRGRRMGGQDKGLVSIAGQSMVAYVLRALRPQVGPLLISANRNPERYAAFGHPVLPDTLPGYAGPLAGIAAALRGVRTEFAAVVPCDAPLLAPDLVARLQEALCRAWTELAVAHDGERRQPLFLLLRASLAPDLEAFLAGGGRRVDAWLDRLAVAEARFDAATDAFVNVNDPAQWRRTEARLLSSDGAG